MILPQDTVSRAIDIDIARRAEDRFWAKVDKSGDCWIWKARIDKKGYGHFRLGPKKVLAHRMAYVLVVGALDPDLVIDHICRNPSCVRPDHLRQITLIENCMIGESPMAKFASRDSCSRGHLYSESNVRYDGGKRVCRKCCVINSTRYQQRKREVTG